ncbi:MAG TPA: hypothetical protein VLJ68_07285 [Chitinophagaceae bacterium]|nr:hypothetical protein [Chitinophagaceae bacterium]
MSRKKKIGWVGMIALLLNLMSVYLFLQRNKLGNFTKQVSYEKLYSATEIRRSGIQRWKKIMDEYPADQVSAGRKLSQANAGISEQDLPLDKMIKIGAWLNRSFRKCPSGHPSSSFQKLSLTNQYQAAAEARTPVWCVTYASQFLFFCAINGIVCRCIESTNDANHHMIVECFIPELQQWVFADIQNNVIYGKDKNGKFLNTVDLLYRNIGKDTAAFSAYGQLNSDSMQVVPRDAYAGIWKNYFDSSTLLRFYYKIDPDNIYTFREKLIRYISPQPWFETFSLKKISNLAFYMRILFLCGGLLATIFYFSLLLRRASIRQNPTV